MPADENRSRGKTGVTNRARTLRRAGNIAEARMWDELKDRQLGGHKFVRQLPIGPYFADFACRRHRLVVELDGSQHVGSKKDRVRDRYMLGQGWSVIRFWNVDALKEMTSVCETILAVVDGRLTNDVEAADLRFMKAGERL